MDIVVNVPRAMWHTLSLRASHLIPSGSFYARPTFSKNFLDSKYPNDTNRKVNSERLQWKPISFVFRWKQKWNFEIPQNLYL